MACNPILDPERREREKTKLPIKANPIISLFFSLSAYKRFAQLDYFDQSFFRRRMGIKLQNLGPPSGPWA